QEAINIYDYTVYQLRAIPLSERKFSDTALYDPGTYHIRLFNTNPSDVNMCVTHLHMLGRTDLKTGVFCNLVASDTALYDPGTYHIRLFNTNPSDVNMCVTHLHMLGRTDLKTGVFCNLVAYVLNEPAFDYLRTKEMLSYYVALQPWVYRDGGSAHRAILLVCRSQATKFPVDHVSGRMNAFWYRIAPRIIAAMTKQSFRTCVSRNVLKCT
ncbi:hypothetical protein AHF37_11462, partial [Paragonimus kellicotti]